MTIGIYYMFWILIWTNLAASLACLGCVLWCIKRNSRQRQEGAK